MKTSISAGRGPKLNELLKTGAATLAPNSMITVSLIAGARHMCCDRGDYLTQAFVACLLDKRLCCGNQVLDYGTHYVKSHFHVRLTRMSLSVKSP
jgi:hypothetical protein